MSNLIIFLRIKNPIQDSFKMIGIFAIVSLPKKKIIVPIELLH